MWNEGNGMGIVYSDVTLWIAVILNRTRLEWKNTSISEMDVNVSKPGYGGGYLNG